MSSPLDRPHTLLDALVYFTDCQIATYGIVAGRKRSARSELKRHRNIAVKMLKECREQRADDVSVVALAQRLAAEDELCAKVHGILTWTT